MLHAQVTQRSKEINVFQNENLKETDIHKDHVLPIESKKLDTISLTWSSEILYMETSLIAYIFCDEDDAMLYVQT